jgi:hypothetical protein
MTENHTPFFLVLEIHTETSNFRTLNNMPRNEIVRPMNSASGIRSCCTLRNLLRLHYTCYLTEAEGGTGGFLGLALCTNSNKSNMYIVRQEFCTQ